MAGRNLSKARRINEEDVRLREAAEIRAELKRITSQKRGDLLELNTPFRQAMAAGVGGFALFAHRPAGEQKLAQGRVTKPAKIALRLVTPLIEQGGHGWSRPLA